MSMNLALRATFRTSWAAGVRSNGGLLRPNRFVMIGRKERIGFLFFSPCESDEF